MHNIASFLRQTKSENIPPSPLYSAPGFEWLTIMVDVLHTLDLGVSQVVLGHLFVEFWNSSLAKGNNRETKTIELWNLIKDYYNNAQPPTRISKLTVEMIKQDGKGPKFRGKGAETRHMVPFGVQLAKMMADHVGGNDLRANQIVSMMEYLFGFYTLFGQIPFDASKASLWARRFCLIYSDLSRKSSKENLWPFKPKFHLFIHLAEKQAAEIGDPSLFWAYRDEDFVGLIGAIAMPRGGKRLGTTMPNTVVDKYRALS